MESSSSKSSLQQSSRFLKRLHKEKGEREGERGNRPPRNAPFFFEYLKFSFELSRMDYFGGVGDGGSGDGMVVGAVDNIEHLY